MIERYEKPAMKKVELRGNKNVADKCWGYAASGEESEVYYYELDNKNYGGKDTWIGFKVTGGGNCNSIKDITYRTYVYGPAIDTDDEKVAAERELDAHIQGYSKPNAGSPFNDYFNFETVVGRSW